MEQFEKMVMEIVKLSDAEQEKAYKGLRATLPQDIADKLIEHIELTKLLTNTVLYNNAVEYLGNKLYYELNA